MREVGTDDLRRVRRAVRLGLFRALGPAALAGGTYFLVDGVSGYLATLADLQGPALSLGKPVTGLALLLVGGCLSALGWIGRWGRYAAKSGATDEVVGLEVTDLSCPRCLHINEPGASVCSGCGSHLENHRFCSRCRRENAPDCEFCYHCGQQLCV